MAGRGTDIKLGDGVEELGGLAVMVLSVMNQDVLMINYVDVQDAKVIEEIVVLPIFTR